MTVDVSVIIAAYNVGPTIERAIRSALDQQSVDVEIIVINDASTDDTSEKITAFNDPRITLVNRTHNSGPAAARNAGIEAATAPWIAVLDGDDAFAPNRLRHLLDLAQKSNADIVIDNLYVRREDGGDGYLMFPPSIFNQLEILDLATFIGCNTSFLGGGIALGYAKPLMKSAFLKHHGLRYDPAIRIGEDYMLMAEALVSGALCIVDKNAGYLYTARTGSISHRLSLDDIKRIEIGDKKFLAHHRLPVAAMAAQKKRTAGLHQAYAFTQLIDALKSRDVKTAAKIILQHPLAALNLRRPLRVRIKRAFCPKNFTPGKTVLLFYKEYEADKFIKYDRHLKRILRPLYQFTHHRQKKTGFAVGFELMCRGLTKAGYDVRVNDYRTAQRHPDYPVGIVGFPLLLNNWDLPNPALLGPMLYDHPMLAPDLFKDTRFKKYLTLAPWVRDMFAPVYGDACVSWFIGIDTDQWPDLCGYPKTYDFLIYDKLYWDHDNAEKTLIQPILDTLRRKGLTWKLIRYKMYDYGIYKYLLQNARAMLFLSAHETQGFACQEAMASGLPILAYDQGRWQDPLWKKYSSSPPKTSSVPFFGPECGETFVNITGFENALDLFMAKRTAYKPRLFVKQNLNMLKSAKEYAAHYFGLIKQGAT